MQMPINVGIVSLRAPIGESDPEDTDNSTDVKVIFTHTVTAYLFCWCFLCSLGLYKDLKQEHCLHC